MPDEEEKKRKLAATIDLINKQFLEGINKHAKQLEDGTLENLHDVEHVSLEKLDDHLKPLPPPKKK